MLKRILILLPLGIMVLLFAASCELKRTNPLDPLGNNNIYTPPLVTGLTATGSGAGVVNKFVELKWARNVINTDGYYIYRALAYDAAYSRIDEVGNISSTNIMTRIIPIDSPGFYYFKVSAYKNYSDGTLEGSLSDWTIAYVAN